MAEDVRNGAAASHETNAIVSKTGGIENHFANISYNPVDCATTNSQARDRQDLDETVSFGDEGRNKESRAHRRQNSYSAKSDDDGGKRECRTHHRQDSNAPSLPAPPRLLVVSNKTKNNVIMLAAALPNVTTVQYKYESVTLEALLGGYDDTV